MAITVTGNNITQYSFLRKGTPLTSSTAAVEVLNSADVKEAAVDGSMVLARYTDSGVVKTVAALYYKNGDTVDVTIVDPTEILKTIESTKGSIESGIATSIDNALTALTASTVAGDGKVVTDVTQTKGKITATATAVKDIKLTGFASSTATTGDVAATDTVADAINKLQNGIKDAKTSPSIVGTNPITVTTGTTGATIGLKVDTGATNILKTTTEGIKAEVTISAVTASSTNVREEYALVSNGTKIEGATIKVYNDSSLKSVELTTSDGSNNGQFLKFTYILATGAEDVVYLDVSTFLAESEFKDGLQVSNGQVSVLKDPASEAFLSVSSAGVKVSGVQTAITSAVANCIQTGDTLDAGTF